MREPLVYAWPLTPRNCGFPRDSQLITRGGGIPLDRASGAAWTGGRFVTRLLHSVFRHKASAGFRRPRRARIAGLLAALAVLVAGSAGLASATPAAAAGSSDWPAYLYNNDHSSYNSAVTAITPSNVSNLQPVWRGMQPATSNGVFYASPTVANGVMYIGGENGYFYAVSESTHDLLWSKFMGTTPGTTCGSSAGISSTAVVADDPTTGETVYVNAPDGQLYALNPTTGAVDWQATVDTPSTTVDDYYAWGSPLVANGNVYVGISSDCDNPLVPAGVVEFNQDTGAQEANWHDLPGTETGGSVWSSPGTSTLGDGSIFVTTGNADAAADNQAPYSESIVRLSSSLSVLDSWQVPLSQRSNDGDFGGSPTDFTATINGTTTQMVGACNKNGYYYAFSQDDLAAGPVWQTQLADASGTGPENGGCDAAAIWDGTNLIEGVGNTTTINGVSYQGAVVSLNPATGAPIWQTGLPGAIIGSPTEDGAGVVAAPVFESNTGNLGVYLLSASTGAILGEINTGSDQVFAQPVFANNVLIVTGGRATGVTVYQVTKPGPPITAVTPDAVGQGGTETVTLTGSGFSGTPIVFVSGTGVTATSAVDQSSTQIQVKIAVSGQAAAGARNITVIEPGLTADTCSSCLTVDPAPVVSSLSPDSLAPDTRTVVTVTGSNFVSGFKVGTSIPGATVGPPTNVTSTSFTVAVTVPASAAAGNYALGVRNPDGGQGTSALSVS